MGVMQVPHWSRFIFPSLVFDADEPLVGFPFPNKLQDLSSLSTMKRKSVLISQPAMRSMPYSWISLFNCRTFL
jgi:hypothetical protein